MTRIAWVALPNNVAMAGRLAQLTKGEHVDLDIRRFPDGETYLRVRTGVAGKHVAILASLDRPDEKFLTIAYAAATLRELGATRIGLVAPYLAYMRQDRRFNAGEAVTSRLFADKISTMVDWLVTVDPHLHRYADLDAIYHVPNRVVQSQARIGRWIRDNIQDPLVIGPDAESRQWVEGVAAAAGCPWVVLGKRRLGDQRVAIELPDLSAVAARSPVLVDDIISSGATMIEAAERLKAAGMRMATCVGIHAIFAGDSYRKLEAVTKQIVTANTIPHPSNGIDLSEEIAAAVLGIAQDPGTSTPAP